MNDYDRYNLVSNIVGAMSGISGPKKDLIIRRQVCHSSRTEVKLGTAVVKGLGVDAEVVMSEMKHLPA